MCFSDVWKLEINSVLNLKLVTMPLCYIHLAHWLLAADSTPIKLWTIPLSSRFFIIRLILYESCIGNGQFTFKHAHWSRSIMCKFLRLMQFCLTRIDDEFNYFLLVPKNSLFCIVYSISRLRLVPVWFTFLKISQLPCAGHHFSIYL